MAPHFSPKEMDLAHAWSMEGHTPVDVHACLRAQRARRRLPGPGLTTARRFLKDGLLQKHKILANFSFLVFKHKFTPCWLTRVNPNEKFTLRQLTRANPIEDFTTHAFTCVNPIEEFTLCALRLGIHRGKLDPLFFA